MGGTLLFVDILLWP